MPTRYIHIVDPKLHETAFVALRDEVNNLFVKTMKFALLLANIKSNDVFGRKYDVKKVLELNKEPIEFNYKKAYESIKEIEVKIFQFVAILSQQELTPEERQNLEMLLASVRESVYAAKILKDVKKNMDEFSQSNNKTILDIYDAIRKNLVYAILIYINYMEEEWSSEKCMDKFHNAEEENQHIMKEATLAITKTGINDKKVVSLLNTNRSVFIASQALYNASKSVSLHFPLED